MNVRATEICLFRNMEGDKVRNVKFLRDTPAFPTDEKTLLQVLSVETDGEFFPLEEPKLRMEVIGDSITSGEGCAGIMNGQCAAGCSRTLSRGSSSCGNRVCRR